VRKENVIGKVVLAIQYVGYIGYFVRTPIGFILLIVVPASIIIIIEIRNIIKELKKSKNSKFKIVDNNTRQRPSKPDKSGREPLCINVICIVTQHSDS